MKPEMILQSDMLDILFEGRNKEYGAYNLRRIYNSHLLKALGVVLLLGIAFAVLQGSHWGSKGDKTATIIFNKDTAVVVLRTVELPKAKKEKLPEPIIPKKASAPAPAVKTVAAATLKIVPDEQVIKPIKSVDSILKENVAISTVDNTDGKDAIGGKAGPVTASGGTGDGGPKEQPVAAELEEIVRIAEKMPMFPGGEEALRRFLGKNLRMPDGAVEEGQRVKIPTRFVVNKNGELTDVVLPDGANEALKKEILRVMHKMPRWIPGSQNGRTVAVYFSIPIIFENLVEQ